MEGSEIPYPVITCTQVMLRDMMSDVDDYTIIINMNEEGAVSPLRPDIDPQGLKGLKSGEPCVKVPLSLRSFFVVFC